MAFQTSIRRDGEWVTETVNFQAALKAYATPKSASRPHPEPPSCGILSRTIVDSPMIHQILPVRLRSEAHNDIAFVGLWQDHFVQISELRRDGQVHEVVRKSDFGSRIRRAAVLGDSPQHGLDDDDLADMVKSEDKEMLVRGSFATEPHSRHRLPPQLLVLVLESGDTMYMFLRERQDSTLEFVIHKRESPRNLSYFGYHLSVDPSSRYMAAASPDGVLVIYELESMVALSEKYRLQGFVDPIKSIRIRVIQGVVHKLEFLYPRPEDDYHIILLLIVTRKERRSAEPVSRMLTYEWEVGDNLKEVFAEEKTGNRLPKEHRMPSLLIPLRFNTAFFTVSQPDIGIVKNCLSGSPVFEVLDTDTPERTPLHHGIGNPLWTAWSRPFRRKKYFEKTDIIYLAREDGAIIHVEIDAPELVPSVTTVGCLNTNINTAFTIAYDIFSDVLIIGGDSGPGGIWKLAPRTDLEQVSVLPNWSPVVDMATSSGRPLKASSTSEHRNANSRSPERKNLPSRPDSLFSASGRGIRGNLTQWRWGIQGRIGLDIETGEPIRRSWGLTMNGPEGNGLYGLLALPNSSTLLHFSADFNQVDAVGADSTAFDLTSRTLHAYQAQSGLIVQITESSIALILDSQASLHALPSILGITGIRAENAFGADDLLVLSTHNDGNFQLHILQVEGMNIRAVNSWGIAGEATCVSLFKIAGNYCVISGSVIDSTSWVSAYALDGTAVIAEAVDRRTADASAREIPNEAYLFEPLTSICIVRETTDSADFVAGTRCGHVLNFRILDQTSKRVTWNSEAMGVAPVDVFPTRGEFGGDVAAMACCDNNLTMMSNFSPSALKFQNKNFIWLTDSNDASMPSPAVHSVFGLGVSLSGHSGHMSLMILAGSRLLFAEVWPHFSLIPRSLPLNGTPTRVIFSQAWNCLVAAILQDGKSTLAFIDPDSGMHIASACDKDRNPLQFIWGLGHSDDRIYGLGEWLYVKDGKTFAFLLVTTKEGRLLIVSVNKLESRPGRGGAGRLQYWTRWKKMLAKPIYSIVGDNDGIIYCVDRTIHWDVLDLTEKKLRPVKEYEVDSPVTSLRVFNGKIFALTTMHSLEVIDHRAGEDNTMSLIHTDAISRITIHMTDIGTDGGASDVVGRWPITLLSDHRGGLAGVWIPWGQRDKEFQTIFEATLPTSIRRFTHARSRPLWVGSETRNRYGVVASSEEGSEVFGVSLDGSLRHFTLVNLELWRILSLMQTLALRRRLFNVMGGSPSDSDSMVSDDDNDIEPHVHPKLMHIDGDLLSRCLENRLLEKIIGTADGLDLFCEYLDALDGGRWTDRFRDGIGSSEGEREAAYFNLGYDILGYILAPVL
ncbi:thermotolerance protein [Metarhizium album ARSEF 1941]|uniref:Thermotolerance protein n=1 Tax=Metarhizium album (strain ARSEF 1941) TaxID=1081103 RepID=A0A0B2WWS6_METAS|nr:thermotolerance protein [Metarhizium album ARSEF 1941]KHN97877.1 thermotolerance protein [Metarhizium album ARSEF 1941]